MSVEQTHEERETLAVDVELPGHAPRTETSLFERTKKALHARENGRCFLCGQTEAETGMPHEAHHHPVERSLATAWDWPRSGPASMPTSRCVDMSLHDFSLDELAPYTAEKAFPATASPDFRLNHVLEFTQ